MKKIRVFQSIIITIFILSIMACVPSVHAISTKAEKYMEEWHLNKPGNSLQLTQPSGITWVWDTLRKIVALLIVGLLMAWLVPNFLTAFDSILREKPGTSAGIGALIFFSFPLGMVVLIGVIVLMVFLFSLATLGNIAGLVALLGIASTVTLIISFIVTLSYLVKIILGFFLGRMIISLIKQEWCKKVWLETLIGSIVVALLISIPWIGWLLSLVIDLFGLGALWLYSRKGKYSKK